MKRLLNVLHPFLIALSPVLFLYAHNIAQVLVRDTFISSAVVLLLAALALGLFLVLFRNLQKAAIATSLFLILFFSYGHAFALKEEYNIRLRYLVGLFGVLFFGGLITIARLRRDMKEVARSL